MGSPLWMSSMPSNVKDVPSTDSEVKLSSYGTSPPIPHTNRTYLGPHDITKKERFLETITMCVCVCVFCMIGALYEMYAYVIRTMCILMSSVCCYVCVNVFVISC